MAEKKVKGITSSTYNNPTSPPKGFVCADGGKVNKAEYLRQLREWQEEQSDVEEFKKERKTKNQSNLTGTP